METLLLIGGLLLFVALIVVHEFGHFIMARRNGVDVEEFGVGFPPKVATLAKDKKGTEYTLNLLPIGGFVRLKGEHDKDTEKGSFGAASFWVKTKIILAGVAMNLFTAWLVLTILAVIGLPQLPLPNNERQFSVASDTKVSEQRVYIGYVEPDGPADKAGLERGDQLLLVRGQQDVVEVKGNQANPTDMSSQGAFGLSGLSASGLRSRVEELLKSGESDIVVVVDRDGSILELQTSPRSLKEVEDSQSTESPKGYLGLIPYDFVVQKSTWSAPIVAVGVTAQYARLTYASLGSSIVSLFQGKPGEAGENVSGPIGIFVVLKEGASLGAGYILLIIALLSLTLAIMNTLPIPALDGGKLAVMALFRLIKKPLTPALEEKIHGTGFVLVMLLAVVITVVDVRRF
jgi:regulator of sigma E protease